MNSLKFLDVGVFCLLLCFFFVLFGKHSLEKFLKEATFIIEDKIDFDMKYPPAITICATKQGNGWKPEILQEHYFKEFQNLCDVNSTDEALACLKQNTFNLNETIKNATIYTTTKLPTNSWDTDITLFSAGQCHTLDHSFTMGTDRTKMLFIDLAKENSYYITIHEPQLSTIN